MELLQMLTSQLGVSETQAEGGAGLLLKLAKENLGSGDFKQVSDAVPGRENLISAAPESGGVASMLGGLASSFGGSNQLGNLASLAGGFKNLNMDSGLIGQFIPIILSFVQSKGGDIVKGLLEKLLNRQRILRLYNALVFVDYRWVDADSDYDFVSSSGNCKVHWKEQSKRIDVILALDILRDVPQTGRTESDLPGAALFFCLRPMIFSWTSPKQGALTSSNFTNSRQG